MSMTEHSMACGLNASAVLRDGKGKCVQVNDWMEGMIVECYEDLYRFKGVLAIKGWPDKFIFQASQPQCL